MELRWNPPETAPKDGTLFIYTNQIKPESRRSAGIVSQCFWREADEYQNEGFYDADIADKADIAGWLPRPTELA